MRNLSSMSEGEKPVFVRGRVPESLRVRFKATCALEGRDMGDVLKELIENWLEEKENPLPRKRSRGS
ncbi:plasmid partition protein ParG [Lyngbya aestuarii]|uniref:plasmid partition protein ParG n=1 Tax=Lyngbya aestuarii TaxID=118322 RepID=UPI00403DA149